METHFYLFLPCLYCTEVNSVAPERDPSTGIHPLCLTGVVVVYLERLVCDHDWEHQVTATVVPERFET